MASLRIPPSYGHDPRSHRDEDGSLFKPASQRGGVHPVQHDNSITPSESRPSFSSERPLSPLPDRRHVVIPDPVAFKYLEEDKSVAIVERRAELTGYELYLVEQWACSRQSPTLVIVTFTGDARHSVFVGVLSVPADEKAWSPRLRVYFKAIQQYHARPKETELGELMVTNLSSFPSALTVIPVPGGNIKNQRRIFIVNEDLKRLGCSGRSGMTLSKPTPTTEAKFQQLYKTDDKVSVEEAVVELVKLCQVALSLFGNLDPVYIDGLLCDVTETAIGDWWTEFGVEYFNMEPTDGILGPTTVAALLGLLMGARNRLSYLSAPVPKDVFDVDTTERGISSFQKYNKLERSRKLDRQTMHKLHTVTAKAASGEGWGVQKAVKSTMTEIGGKRGEIVLGMVSGRDKGAIGDIETVDLDKFISLLSGERAKWLWYGKARRVPALEHEKSGPDMILFGNEDASTPLEDENERRRKEETPPIYSAPAPGSAVSVADSPGDRDAMRRGVFKSVARDARSGFRQIKDVVTSGGGLLSHGSKLSRDEYNESGPSSAFTGSPGGLVSSPAPLPNSAQIGRAFTWKEKPQEYLSAMKKERDISEPSGLYASSSLDEAPPRASLNLPRSSELSLKGANDAKKRSSRIIVPAEPPLAESTVAGSTSGGENGKSSERSSRSHTSMPHLRRRHSAGSAQTFGTTDLKEARWARRLSFADAQDAILQWEEIADFTDLETAGTTGSTMALLDCARHMYVDIDKLDNRLEPWVSGKVQLVDNINEAYAQQLDDLQALYQQSQVQYERAHHESQSVLANHKEHLQEAVNRLEGESAKLEYEITALMSKVEDVEDAAAQFEIQVQEMEKRADELKGVLEKEGWLHWAVRRLTGIGTGPNITRVQ
ncbi:hypothetical protein F5Y18DRAFT_378463 [Xylariaceae sp. FL1019]|nr:hypothetical protein F5Y18DRAFT_378463 [Xylariaceae sp. FL1019]